MQHAACSDDANRGLKSEYQLAEVRSRHLRRTAQSHVASVNYDQAIDAVESCENTPSNSLERDGDVSKMRWKVPTRGQDSTFNTFPVSGNNLKPEFESLAEMLKNSGYISARFGKWHAGEDNQGFDVLSASGTLGEITNYNGSEKRYYDDIHVAERLTDLTLDFIDQNKDKPFFVYISHWEVHTPLAARPDRIRYFRRKAE